MKGAAFGLLRFHYLKHQLLFNFLFMKIDSNKNIVNVRTRKKNELFYRSFDSFSMDVLINK